MLLKDFIPAPDIRDIVQLYRIVHFRFDPGQPVPYKAYPPRPEQCLAFYPYDTETVQYQQSGKVVQHVPVVLYGQFFEVTNRMISHNFLVFQIIFWPGALCRLTGMPASEITNEYLDAETYFSSDLRLVNEQLYHAKDYPAMIEVANTFIRGRMQQRLQPKLLIDDACMLMMQSDRKYTVDYIASQSCLSTRQLERKFGERTGVNPKMFERIIRFDRAFRLKNSHPEMDWLRIAVECNFHDYQHLAKTYQSFTGLTPTAFHEIENKAPERTFGLSEGYYS